MFKKHIAGASAKVEVWNPIKRVSEFFDCEITGTVSAMDDCDYRVNVKLPDGREFNSCAPECVVVSNKNERGLTSQLTFPLNDTERNTEN